MTVVFFKLTKAQTKAVTDAYRVKTAVTLNFTKAQLQSSGAAAFEGAVPVPLNVHQFKRYQSAKNLGQKLSITIAATSMRIGGFLPLLLAAIPGLLGAAPGIAKG